MHIKDLNSAYFNAWNAHDCAAISATFAADGIYSSPSTGEISGKKLEIFAEHVWQAFPDYSLKSQAMQKPAQLNWWRNG